MLKLSPRKTPRDVADFCIPLYTMAGILYQKAEKIIYVFNNIGVRLINVGMFDHIHCGSIVNVFKNGLYIFV